MKWIRVIIIFLAAGILYLSFTRAGLELVSRDEKIDNLRKIPVQVEWSNNQGQIEKHVYNLPETRTLPNNWFYGLKELRDSLWINLSNDRVNKLRIVQLVADKKMSEAIILDRQNKEKWVIKSSQEAIKKLKLADELVGDLNQKEIEVQLAVQRLEMAKKFYKEVIKSFRLEIEEKDNLIKSINEITKNN